MWGGEFLKRVGERMGIVETVADRTRRLERHQTYLEDMQRMHRERQVGLHYLVHHSDACQGEIEYVMGITNKDPHPGHAIQYRQCDCEEHVSPPVELGRLIKTSLS